MRVDLLNLPDPTPLVAAFRSEVMRYDARRLLRQRVVFGDCFVFRSREDEYSLLQEVSDHFQVHPAAATIVGSGKLGFSLAPDTRYKPFHDKSDLDLVLIDERLFDRLWWEIHEAVSGRYDWPARQTFSDYLMRGWIRPDKFPEVGGTLASGWWDYCRKLSKQVGVKIRVAVYKDWRFFEAYHTIAISMCARAERITKDAAQTDLLDREGLK